MKPTLENLRQYDKISENGSSVEFELVAIHHGKPYLSNGSYSKTDCNLNNITKWTRKVNGEVIDMMMIELCDGEMCSLNDPWKCELPDPQCKKCKGKGFIVENDPIYIFQRFWHQRNPCHEVNLDTGKDMFWETAELVAREYVEYMKGLEDN